MPKTIDLIKELEQAGKLFSNDSDVFNSLTIEQAVEVSKLVCVAYHDGYREGVASVNAEVDPPQPETVEDQAAADQSEAEKAEEKPQPKFDPLNYSHGLNGTGGVLCGFSRAGIEVFEKDFYSKVNCPRCLAVIEQEAATVEK